LIKILNQSKYFRLTQETTSKGRKFYRIRYYTTVMIHDKMEEIRDVIDPLRNISRSQHSLQWRFSNRKEAEQLYTMLLLRWA
jgi:hypothetical protein